MTSEAYRKADSDAARCGRIRARLARWWRPLVDVYLAGSMIFLYLLAFERLGMISLAGLHPWGWFLIMSMLCLIVTFPLLLVLIPLDIFWDHKMRKAFQHHRDATRDESNEAICDN